MNLPFQFAAGIHSSALMCESEVGFSTSRTRQCAGSAGAAAGAAPPRPAAGAGGVAPGATNGPAGAELALMATCDVDIASSISHGVAAAAAMTTRLSVASMGDLLSTTEPVDAAEQVEPAA